MARQADAARGQQAPEIDQVGADQQRVGRHRQRLAATDAVDRLIDAKNEMSRKALGNALRAPADAAAGVENQRRPGLPLSAGSQCGSEGSAVVVENRLAERMREVAANQHFQIAVRPVLRADDEARVAVSCGERQGFENAGGDQRRSISSAALIGRRRW